MQASQQMRRGVHPLAILAALISAMLLSAAAGYLLRGGPVEVRSQTTQAPAPASHTVPSWTQQGTGPTDADAAQAASVNIQQELVPDAVDRNAAARAQGQREEPVVDSQAPISHGALP